MRNAVTGPPRANAERALRSARQRLDQKCASRETFRTGEPGPGRCGVRAKLAELGVQYVTADEHGL